MKQVIQAGLVLAFALTLTGTSTMAQDKNDPPEKPQKKARPGQYVWDEKVTLKVWSDMASPVGFVRPTPDVDATRRTIKGDEVIVVGGKKIAGIGETPTVKTEITDSTGAVYTVVKVTSASQAAQKHWLCYVKLKTPSKKKEDKPAEKKPE